MNQIRPDRQTLLFSATFPEQIQELAADILNKHPVTVSIGKPADDGKQAVFNQDITQKVLIFPKQENKVSWLIQNIADLTQQNF